MPIYTYKCDDCDACVEIDKKLSALERDERCEECGSLMARIPSLTAFHLKGGGWARDGYSNAPSGNKGG